MTSKLTILSIDPEAAGRDVRHLQETVLLLEQLRQLLENIGSRDLADRAAHAAGALQEEWACRERTAIDRHIADGRRLVRGLTERLGSLPGSR